MNPSYVQHEWLLQNNIEWKKPDTNEYILFHLYNSKNFLKS